MVTAICIDNGKRGLLRSSQRRKSLSLEKPKCSVAFCETVEFRTIYVSRIERLGQFYDLNNWDMVTEEGDDYKQNILVDFVAQCIPLKDFDGQTGDRRIKRSLWRYGNYEDSFTVSWLDSVIQENNPIEVEDQECLVEFTDDPKQLQMGDTCTHMCFDEFNDEYKGDLEGSLHEEVNLNLDL
ncbi:hypothetical protein ACR3K2_17120 [Cryptosporidium serpentis]